MNVPRDAWWEKWRRGEEHRRALADEIVETFSDQRNRVRMRIERGPSDREYLFRVSAPYTAPVLRWAIVIGDVVHNYRAALDHMAWRLALIHSRGAEPRNAIRIVFPIYDDPEKFERSPIRASFDAFHWDILGDFQPMHGLKGRPDSWSGEYIHQLALLQNLSNEDKHQRVTPVMLPPSGFQFPGGLFQTARRGDWFPWEPLSFADSEEELSLGSVVIRMQLRDGAREPDNSVESTATPSVSFPRHGPIAPALERIGQYVVDILRELDPLV